MLFILLTYQLQTVRYLLTVTMTGNGGLGSDSGEGAWDAATTSKECSRHATYPILEQWGSDQKQQCWAGLSSMWNETMPMWLYTTHWRASLVPAAAVIPASIVYIMIVVVKLPVVLKMSGINDLPTGFVPFFPNMNDTMYDNPALYT